MTFNNYSSNLTESSFYNISYEEQLLLQYDDFLKGVSTDKKKISSPGTLWFRGLETNPEKYKLESFCLKNNWDEEHSDETSSEELEEDDDDSDTFEMKI